MKILVVNNAVPFTWGGAEELAANLAKQINERRGLQAEVLRIPFAWEPKERLVGEIILNRALSIYNTDRVVALKFPAYLIEHHHKSIWLLHQFRQAYDLLDAGHSYLDRERDRSIVEAIRRADDACFAGANAIFANSRVTQGRLKRYNGRNCGLLYPPLNDAELFEPGGYGDYIFAGGRIDPGKRQHLLIEAAIRAGEKTRMLVAGPATDHAYVQKLQALIAHHSVGHRIELQVGLHPRLKIGALAREALACAYIPYDEDSLGYVTMEGAAAARPLITTSDSGGLLELVRHEDTGLVVAPEVDALASALSGLSADPARARALGQNAKSRLDGMDLTWDATIRRLLS